MSYLRSRVFCWLNWSIGRNLVTMPIIRSRPRLTSISVHFSNWMVNASAFWENSWLICRCTGFRSWAFRLTKGGKNFRNVRIKYVMSWILGEGGVLHSRSFIYSRQTFTIDYFYQCVVVSSGIADFSRFPRAFPLWAKQSKQYKISKQGNCNNGEDFIFARSRWSICEWSRGRLWRSGRSLRSYGNFWSQGSSHPGTRIGTIIWKTGISATRLTKFERAFGYWSRVDKIKTSTDRQRGNTRYSFLTL